MDGVTRTRIRNRAGDRCEYCHSKQADESFFRFQVDHCIPSQHGGSDEIENLALACSHCNLHKGPNLAGLDPFDGRLAVLFNPRLQIWEEHFALRLPIIVGLTAIGRATVRVLNMNDRLRVELRAATAINDESTG